MTLDDPAPAETGIADRFAFAKELAEAAGALALDFFQRRDALAVETKRHAQDLVSEADRSVETLIRERIAKAFPKDGILGEEFGLEPGSSGLTWVIDPIDGTSPFLNGMPNWCVSVGVSLSGEPVIGVIAAPCHRELYAAMRGGGATLNGTPIRVTDTLDLRSGVVGLGSNDRVPPSAVAGMIANILEIGGGFIRNGSGALMLAYVAAGRLVGYAEPSMNAWDCMAGHCLILEAGGKVLPFPGDALTIPARILAAAPDSFDELDRLSAVSVPLR
ncbi:inositol monophosphatase family protein [Stappia indica]|uniref:inositol monophosphatase family protein n=1 Tax=Stappia indica TaxID=538381 RepID=UPI0021E5582E